MKTEVKIEETHTTTQMGVCQCDLCGATTHKTALGGRQTPDWWVKNPKEHYTGGEETVTMSYHKANYGYGDSGGTGSAVSVDLCPTCFLEKLIPWLKSQGVSPKEDEYYF